MVLALAMLGHYHCSTLWLQTSASHLTLRCMKIALVLISSLLGLSLAACSDKATTVDAPKVVDSRIVDGPKLDAPTVDAPRVDARMASATWIAVHNEFKALCQPCHGNNGGSGGHKMGQTDVLRAFADSQLNSSFCAGKKKGACAADRIRAGDMPAGNPLSTGERARVAGLIDAWVTAGQP